MAQETGNQATVMTEALQSHPSEFDLFQALRRLECLHPDRPRIGESLLPCEDLVQLHQHVALEWASASVADYQAPEGDSRPQMWVNAPGLLGPNGPLPLGVTEYVQERLHHHKDSAPAAFLDLFNHRMLCLFYRAWAGSQQCVSYDRPGNDPFTAYLASCIGAANPGETTHTPDHLRKLYFAGRLVPGPRSAEGLKAMLQDILGIPTEIHELLGEWDAVHTEDRCRLGKGDAGCQLGAGALIGGAVVECQHRFLIRLGPMSYQDYQSLNPGSERLCRLTDWVRTYVGDEFDFVVQLVLGKSEVPEPRLNGTCQLGRSCWVRSRPLPHDPDDLRIRSRAAA
jgi:type VI secretion system protein ImpH